MAPPSQSGRVRHRIHRSGGSMHTTAGRDEESAIPESIVSGRVAQWRMASGLLQGIILYALYWSAKHTGWPAAHPYLFVPLVMVFLLVPPLFISGLGHLGNRRLAVWTIAASAICALLAMHDVWRNLDVPGGSLAGIKPD